MRRDFVKFSPAFFIAAMAFFGAGLVREYFSAVGFITIHEFFHILPAAVFGAELEEVYFTPFGACAKLDKIDEMNMSKKLVIYLSGPLSSIVIGLLFYIMPYEITKYFAGVNIALGVLNMIPIFPLDGGRIALIFIEDIIGTLKTLKIIHKLSKVAAVVLMIIGVLQLVLYPFNMSIIIIGKYFYGASKDNYIDSLTDFYGYVLAGNRPSIKKVNLVYAQKSTSLRALLKFISPNKYLVVCFESAKGDYVFASQNDIAEKITMGGIVVGELSKENPNAVNIE